ncbi:hypothetical protein E6B08_30700 (plasmid) [Pseudomonas putida]|uniref:Mobilization protein MobC n=1 Tax=Pseudomonas putida TaxID=303 RepID=A0A4D6XHV6_PSEPU|nr:hypothetical protein [Pseudomonas putida]QCI15683.1 hypothetical protein E6B08_30700 [Pseudomonas putida]
MGFTISQIEKLMGDLENLPEVEQPDKPVSKLKAVEMMQGSIKELQSRGYSLAKISEILTAGGMQISETTLKSYLTRARGSVKGKTRRTPKARLSLPARIAKAGKKNPLRPARRRLRVYVR